MKVTVLGNVVMTQAFEVESPHIPVDSDAEEPELPELNELAELRLDEFVLAELTELKELGLLGDDGLDAVLALLGLDADEVLGQLKSIPQTARLLMPSVRS